MVRIVHVLLPWSRLLRSAIVLKPSTLMAFHRVLVNVSTACFSRLNTVGSLAREGQRRN